jgi:hypothetical protein
LAAQGIARRWGRPTSSIAPAFGTSRVLSHDSLAALLAKTGAATSCGQGGAQWVGLGHVAEAVQSPSNSSRDLGIDGPGPGSPLDQLINPADQLTVERVKRVTLKVLRQLIAQRDRARDRLRRPGFLKLCTQALEARLWGGRCGAESRISFSRFKRGCNPAQEWDRVLFDQVSGTPGCLGIVGHDIEELCRNSEELTQYPSRQRAAAQRADGDDHHDPALAPGELRIGQHSARLVQEQSKTKKDEPELNPYRQPRHKPSALAQRLISRCIHGSETHVPPGFM